MPGKDSYSEQLILKKVADGDPEAFQELFNTYWDSVFASGLYFLKSGDLAKDLAQEVFIKIWMTRDRLVHVKQFEPYLHRISKNLFLDNLRKRLVTTSRLEEDHERRADELNPQRQLELNELEGFIGRAIDFLPAQMQTAFKLSRFHGLTHEEIAGKMKISKVTSQNYIARSLIIIRRYLTQQMEIPVSGKDYHRNSLKLKSKD